MSEGMRTDTSGADIEEHVVSREGASAGRSDRGASEPGAWRKGEEEGETGFLPLLNVLLKRWKLVMGLPFVAAFLTAGVTLVLPEQFTATAIFVPETESKGVNLPAGLAGVAAQFGVALPSGGASSPSFYADVLKSRTLRDQVLLARFPNPWTSSSGDSARLLDLLEVGGETEPARLEEGRKLLAERSWAQVDNETGIVRVSVQMPDPALSADVTNHFVTLLHRFNLETRQSNAQERRRFIEERLGEAERELRRAEEELKRFYERNRQYEGSPELRFQADRLEREVASKQEVVTTLRRQYEESRIQEVNDTPVITVIDRAVPPAEKSSPKRRVAVLLAFFVGGALGVFGSFGMEYVERVRVSEEDEYEELTSRWASIRRDLTAPLRRLRRRG